MLAVKTRAEMRDYKMVEYLIEDAGADVNLQAARASLIAYHSKATVLALLTMQYTHWSAIFFAVSDGDQKTVQLLYSSKAKMDTKDKVYSSIRLKDSY